MLTGIFGCKQTYYKKSGTRKWQAQDVTDLKKEWGQPIKIYKGNDGSQVLHYHFDAQGNVLGELDTYRTKTIKKVYVNSEGKITKIVASTRVQLQM